MKIADLEVTENKAPTLVVSASAYDRYHASRSWWANRPLEPIVHIVRKHGKSKYGAGYPITNCNRVMVGAQRVTSEKWEEYRLCKRCGAIEDFTEAAEQWEKWQEQLEIERQKLQEELAAEDKRKRHQRILMLAKANYCLRMKNLDCKLKDGHILLRFPFASFKITII